MKRIRKRDILKGILAIIAVANLALLFVFDYEILGFEWSDFYSKKFSYESAGTAQASTAQTAAQAATIAGTESAAIAETTNEQTGTAGASTAEGTVVGDGTKKCRVISSKNARIRSGPGTDHERVTSVPRGTILTVLGVEENGWVHIRTDDGVEGYVSGDLVEMIDEE